MLKPFLKGRDPTTADNPPVDVVIINAKWEIRISCLASSIFLQVLITIKQFISTFTSLTVGMIS